MKKTYCLVPFAVAIAWAALPWLTALQAQPANPFEGSYVRHVGVIVRDVDQAAKTYAEVFGVQPSAPRGLAGQIDFAAVKDFSGDRQAGPRVSQVPLAGNMTIELLSPLGGASPWRAHLDQYGEGLHHINIAVKDVPAAIAHLQALGGRLELGGSPGVTYAYVNMRNQLGFTFELSQMPASPPAAAAPQKQADTALVANSARHIGIIVPDVEKTAAVFSKVIGVPSPAAREYPGIQFPQGFTGDPQAHPKIINFPMNVGIEFAEPKGGASPWRDHVTKLGPAMHHLGMPAIGSMEGAAAALEKIGGRVLLRGPGGISPFVDLAPQPLGLAIELGRPQ